MVKGASTLECKACGKRFNPTLFAPHLKLCKKAAAASMLFEHDAEQIIVKAVDVVTVKKGFRDFGGFAASPDQKDELESHETEKVYKLFVSYFGTPWYVQRSLEETKEFISQIRANFPDLALMNRADQLFAISEEETSSRDTLLFLN